MVDCTLTRFLLSLLRIDFYFIQMIARQAFLKSHGRGLVMELARACQRGMSIS